MSLRQAWRKTTIGNKVLTICGPLALIISLGSALFSYCQLGMARSQYDLIARTNREQRLLEWERLTLEDNAAMPDVTAVTISSRTATDINNVSIRLRNTGNGSTPEVFVDDAATGQDLIPPVAALPAGGQFVATIPANKFDRTRLMRLVCRSPHGSIRTKTFYFLGDNQSRTVSEKVDHSFDFLIVDEPGRKSYVPAASFGFGTPTTAN